MPFETGKLIELLRGLGGAQAKKAGRLCFDGKYVAYPCFRKEWWAHRRTCQANVRNKLVCWIRKKCLASNVKVMMGDVEDLEGRGHPRHVCQLPKEVLS
jgi:hypothetical protein